VRRGAVELEDTLWGTCLAEVLLSQLMVGCGAGGVGAPAEPGDVCWSFAQDVCKGGRPPPLIPYRCFLNIGQILSFCSPPAEL